MYIPDSIEKAGTSRLVTEYYLPVFLINTYKQERREEVHHIIISGISQF